MRVVLVIRRLMDVGGAQTQLRLLAGEVARRGHGVVIVTERVAHIRPPASLHGIPVHPIRSVAVRSLGTFLYVAGLIWYLITRRPQYDLVHVFFFKHSALGAVVAGALARAPVVVRPACTGPPGDLYPLRRQPLWRQAMKLGRRADAFVALSDGLVEELTDFGCPPARVHRIPSAVLVPERTAPPGKAEPTVIFAGRLDPQKGLAILLQAWRRVVDRHSTARLLLLGDGPMRADLVAQARQLDLTGSVTLAGVVDDVPARLARARAFVLPSTDEGMSSALLEAMAAGRAVVVTRVSGTDEVITDGVEGLLVEVGDVPGLAAALERVLADADLADRLGRRARERVRRNHTVERMVDAHLALYRELVGPARVGIQRSAISDQPSASSRSSLIADGRSLSADRRSLTADG